MGDSTFQDAVKGDTAAETVCKTILDALQANVAVLNRRGIILAVNQPWVRFAAENGLPDTARVCEGADYLAVCRQAADMDDPLAREAMDGIQAVLSGDRPSFTLEYPCDSPTQRRWFAMEVRRCGDAGVTLVMHLDVTDRRLAEEALRQSEVRYRALFESAQDAVFVMRQDRFIDCNRAAASLYGCPKEQIVGKTPLELSPLRQPDDRPPPEAAQPKIEAAYAGTSQRFEWRHSRPDGTEFDVEVSLDRLDMGEEPLLLAIVRDITDRKRAAKALEDLINGTTSVGQAFFRSLVRHMAGAVGMRYAFVAEIRRENPTHAFTLAVWDSHDFIPNVEYPLNGSPCENAIHKGMAYHPSGVRQIYPQDKVLRDLQIESYLGMPLRDSGGNVIGILAVMSDRSGLQEEPARSLLSIFSARAASELERLRAENDLRASQQMLQTVLDTIPVRVFWKDRKSNYLGSNHAFALDAGLDNPAELIGKNDYQTAWRDLADLYRRDDRQVIESGLPKLNYEEPQTAPDGRRIWVRTSKIPLVDEEGAIHGVLGVYEEITDWKQAQESLRQSEEQFRSFFESANVGMGQADPSTLRFVRVNNRLCELTGFGREELCSMSPADLTHPGDRQADLKQFMAMVKGQTPDYSNEKRYIRKDGQVVWVQVAARMIHDAAGRPLRTAAVIMDITKRKRAEEALRETTGRLQAIFRASPYAIIVLDPKGKVVAWSPSAEHMFGWSEQEVMGRPLPYVPPDKQQEHLAIRQRVMEGEVVVFEVVRRKKDGTDLILSISAAPLRDLQGNIVGIMSINADVTEQKRNLEALAKYSEELERSNRDLEQFAYVATHDLQEPLRMVSSFLQLLKERHGPALPESANEYMDFAIEGALRMKALIDGLLAYSRLGTQAQAIRPMSAQAAVDAALANLAALIGETNAAVACDTPLPSIKADPIQLTQLFQNLIGNAIKFRADRRPEIHIQATRREGEWLFSVQDNGIGIDAAFQEKVFMIFRRLHTRQKFPSTGIGLAICKRIVERHHGRIWVESVPGRGSTFYFTIPELD